MDFFFLRYDKAVTSLKLLLSVIVHLDVSDTLPVLFSRSLLYLAIEVLGDLQVNPLSTEIILKNSSLLTTKIMGYWLECLTALSTIPELYHGGQFYWWRKPQDPLKTTNCKSLTNFIT